MTDVLLTDNDLKNGLFDNEGNQLLPPITPNALAKLRHQKRIPYKKIFGRVKYSRNKLIKWAKSKEIKPNKNTKDKR